MPQVPTYQSNQIGTTPMSQPQMSGNNPIAGALQEFGQTMQGLSAEAFQVIKHERYTALAAELSGAQGDMVGFQTDLLHNEKTGLMYKQGKEAQQPDPNDPNKSLPSIYDEEVKKRAGEIRSKLHPELQPHFDAFVQSQLEKGHVSVTNHAIQQTRLYNSERNKAAVGNYIEAAAKSADPNDGIDTYWPLTERTILAQAAAEHQPPELTQSQLAAAKSTMYRGAIESMKSKDAPAALAWYEKNKDNLDKKDQEHIETLLKPAVMAQKANAAAEVAWTQLGPRNSHDTVDEYKMEEKVRADLKGDPEAIDRAIQGIRSRRTGWDESVKSTDDSNFLAVKKMMTNGNDPNAIYNSKEYAALPGGDQLTIKEHIEAKIHQKELEVKAEKREQRGEVRAELLLSKQLKEIGDHQAFWRFSQPEWLNTHTEADIERLGLSQDVNDKLHKEMRDAKDPGKAKEQKIDADLFTGLAVTAGYPVHSNNKGDKDKMGELKMRINDAVAVAEARKGSELTRDEKKKEMQRQMIEVPTKGVVYGTNDTPMYKAKKGEIVVPKSWSDVPKKSRELVKQTFEERGRTFNEKNALTYYNLLIQ